IGGDQGGSIRMPSAWSGTVGHKPTYGLVPYTGGFPIERTIDHLGPMGRTVRDVAMMLDVLAGPDGQDPRQKQVPEKTDTLSTLDAGVGSLRIGLLREGFGQPGVSDPNVDALIRSCAASLETVGASVVEVSAPWHAL